MKTLPRTSGNGGAAVPETPCGYGHHETPTASRPESELVKDLDDGTLLDRWRERRDGDAFAEIARRHSPVVFDLTSRVLGDRVGAEDVLQEALLSLALEPTRRPAEVGVIAWLARFAICRARNRRVSERCRSRRQITVGLERPEGAMPDETFERREELEHALAGCDPDDRAILAMRYLHGWEYDRIAAALSIREGAARVRVHRALESVRSKVASNGRGRDPGSVAPALCALPVATLAPERLDATVRSVLQIARVKLGAPANGTEHATAASRSFRVAVATSAVALLAGTALFAAASGGSDGHARHGAESAAAFAEFPGEADVWTALAAASLPTPERSAATAGRVPRPADWDLGGLRALALRSESDGASSGPAAAPAARNPAPEPSAADPGRDPVAAADPVREIFESDVSPSALRPISRDACAAKGDLDSSDGERAGALGGTSVVVAEDPAPAEAAAPEPQDLVPARSAGGVPVAADALPDATRELLGEAETLLRRFLEENVLGSADGAAAGATDVRRAVRDVRREFNRARARTAGRATGLRAKRQRDVLRRVLTMLTRQAFGEVAASEARWPQGADLSAALIELIRVLGATPVQTRLPSGASEGAAAEPSTDLAGPGRGLPSGALR